MDPGFIPCENLHRKPSSLVFVQKFCGDHFPSFERQVLRKIFGPINIENIYREYEVTWKLIN
jgi:hypothetical protein